MLVILVILYLLETSSSVLWANSIYSSPLPVAKYSCKLEAVESLYWSYSNLNSFTPSSTFSPTGFPEKLEKKFNSLNFFFISDIISFINGRWIKSLSVTNKGLLIPKSIHAIVKSFILLPSNCYISGGIWIHEFLQVSTFLSFLFFSFLFS